MLLNELPKQIYEVNKLRDFDVSNETPLFGHLMLDIETMGNESFSSIISIGALEFDIETGKTGKEFTVNVDLQSCIDLGLILTASTVMWWLQQNEQARKDLVEKTALPIQKALLEFSEFCNKDYEIWGTLHDLIVAFYKMLTIKQISLFLEILEKKDALEHL